jgi:hypothetical protein
VVEDAVDAIVVEAPVAEREDPVQAVDDEPDAPAVAPEAAESPAAPGYPPTPAWLEAPAAPPMQPEDVSEQQRVGESPAQQDKTW